MSHEVAGRALLVSSVIALGIVVLVRCSPSGDDGAKPNEAGIPCSSNPDQVGVSVRSVAGHPYYAYVPESYHKAKPNPLVVALHGAAIRAADYVTATWKANADAEGFLVIAPAATVPMGEAYDWQRSDASIIVAAIDDFSACYSVDPRKIILDGTSAGGMMAYWMGLRDARRFSGISIASADLVSAEAVNGAPLLPAAWPIPVGHFHGIQDEAFPVEWALDGVDRLRDAGHPVYWQLFAGGHHYSSEVGAAAALARYESLRSSTAPLDRDAGPAPFGDIDVEGPCNAIDESTKTVAEQDVASSSPTPAGGTIADGTYVLTGLTVYTGAAGDSQPTGRTARGVIAVSAGSYQFAVLDSSAGADLQRTSGGLVTKGSAISITEACPAVGKTGYTAFDSDGTTVTLYTSEVSTAPAWAMTFTRQ